MLRQLYLISVKCSAILFNMHLKTNMILLIKASEFTSVLHMHKEVFAKVPWAFFISPILNKTHWPCTLTLFLSLIFQSITLRRLYLISVKCGAIPFNLLCRVQDYLQWNSARIRSKRSCDIREKSCESTTSISTSW